MLRTIVATIMNLIWVGTVVAVVVYEVWAIASRVRSRWRKRSRLGVLPK